MRKMKAPVGVPVPDTRNPYAGKGLAVTTSLLLGRGRPSTLAQLATMADVSRALVSMVVRYLARFDDLVQGEVTQGRGARIAARPGLFHETSPHWPAPVVSLQGGRLPSDVVLGGGSIAKETLGVLWEAPPRVYVRTLDDARRLVALAGGAEVSAPVAEWDIAVVHFPFEPGPVPAIVAALELGRTPRGRELLSGAGDRLFAEWDEA